MKMRFIYRNYIYCSWNRGPIKPSFCTVPLDTDRYIRWQKYNLNSVLHVHTCISQLPLHLQKYLSDMSNMLINPASDSQI